MTEAADIVLRKHGGRRILGWQRGDGSCAALAYLDSLPKPAGDKFKAAFDLLLEHGRITNVERFRKLAASGRPAVWEMKAHDGRGRRLFMIQAGSDWLVTHGVDKPGSGKLSGHIAKARQIYEDWSNQ